VIDTVGRRLFIAPRFCKVRHSDLAVFDMKTNTLQTFSLNLSSSTVVASMVFDTTSSLLFVTLFGNSPAFGLIAVQVSQNSVSIVPSGITFPAGSYGAYNPLGTVYDSSTMYKYFQVFYNSYPALKSNSTVVAYDETGSLMSTTPLTIPNVVPLPHSVVICGLAAL